ncbi:TetR family transcriptional regulator [Devosia sp. Root413D1]|uniref:TetR/AcrR family transcriptional regulator n=1 Tax=Devosia sp. Root413D1 TaxID=1736531 RepID=UPI0007001B57|nr:TetR/AcrR family transcriptional regulator [Devosia sp. Root413D1]KQW81226.1 TetR family transcriptional regulator [Devosia sp. Root413D1]
MARLSKEDRRQQLLDVALKIVREEGADALTLVSLALRADVSRPVTYEHFGTRPGLLLALYERLERAYVDALREALAAAPRSLPALAALMSSAYFGCLIDAGVEGPALSAALQGSEEMAAQQLVMRDEYVEVMQGELQPFADMPADMLRLCCIGLLGAAEAMAREQQGGRVELDAATRAFTRLIERAVERPVG